MGLTGLQFPLPGESLVCCRVATEKKIFKYLCLLCPLHVCERKVLKLAALSSLRLAATDPRLHVLLSQLFNPRLALM